MASTELVRRRPGHHQPESPSRYAVPDSNLGLVRERARAAYGPVPVARHTTTDSSSDATDSCPDTDAERVEWLGALRDVTAIKGDIISPVSDLSDWNVYRSDTTSGEESDEEGGEEP